MKEWEGTEAQSMEDNSDHGAKEHFAENKAQEMVDLYTCARSTKIGSLMFCPGCGKKIVKTTYNKVFCSNGRTTKGRSSCKDYYWNVITRGVYTPQKVDNGKRTH